MDILKFIIANWDETLIILTIISSTGIFAYKWITKFRNMTQEEKIAEIKRLLENLSPIALTLVTNAESLFGGGTGKLKRSYVIDELYSRIPENYKKYITEDNLDVILEDALEKAKMLWEQNINVQKIIKGE